MLPVPSIFLAYGESSAWDAIIWLVAGIIWLFLQMANAKKQKEKKASQAQRQPPRDGRPSGTADAPTPDELAEIFKRLGADIPATPPPPPKPVPPPAALRSTSAAKSASAARMARNPAPRGTLRKPAAEIPPELARRLAQVRKEAETVGRGTEAECIASHAIAHGVQSRAGETRALETATRHTGAILPRLYAMSMHLAPLPVVPMPGLDRTHHVNLPMRAKLHTRREVRDALIAQNFLRPAKSVSP